MVSPIVVSRIQNRRGTQAQFDALYPPGYNGIGGADITIWPNILLPGELALCTDSRRVILGNLNGEYIDISTVESNTTFLISLITELPPVGSYTVIPAFTYFPTPFFNIIYDITDSSNSDDSNVVGPLFSRSGQITITVSDVFVPVAPTAPFPPITPVTLMDNSVDVNRTSSSDISFMARYDTATSSVIEVLYKHDFTGPIMFSTSSVRWLPF